MELESKPLGKMRPMTRTFKTGSGKGKTGSAKPYTRYRQSGQNDPGGTRHWRQTSQFQITTTDESDTEETEQSSKPETTSSQQVIQNELQKLRLEAQNAAKEKKEMEEKLEKMLKELEETRSSHQNKKDRAEEHLEPHINIAPDPIRSSAPEQAQHVDYARMFLNPKDKSTVSTPGTVTLLANELERDLHLTDLVIETSTATYYAPPPETKIQFLTPAKQVLRDHRDAIENQKDKLTDIITKIKLLETNNVSGQFNKDIRTEEEKYKRLKQVYLGQKQELVRVEQIAERYQPTLEGPEYKEPPLDYKRQFGTLSMKNITNNVPKFDPDNESHKFSYTWQAVLQFGRLEYFTEQEYKQVLSSVLLGSALDTYQEMARQGYSLRHMLDTFADLYAPRNTIEEDQKEVDNFTRKAKEPIRTAMRRFSCLVDKIRCLTNPVSWPDIKYKMCKSVLKQVISIKTRQFIDYEEAKIKKVGGQFEMKELIELVNDYETSHGEVPKEDIAIVYCEASGEPAQWANDLQFRQKFMKQNKHIHEHTKHLANVIEQATQVAASFIKGAQPKSKMKAEAALHQTKKPQRSSSATSYRSAAGDTDAEMTDLDTTGEIQKKPSNNYRADSKDRGRSGYNQKARDQTSQQKGQNRPYSKDRPPRSASKDGYQKSYSKDRQQGNQRSESNQGRSNSSQGRSSSGARLVAAKTNIEREDGKIVFNNQAYYNCTCSSLHMIGQECPKAGMPIHLKN